MRTKIQALACLGFQDPLGVTVEGVRFRVVADWARAMQNQTERKMETDFVRFKGTVPSQQQLVTCNRVHMRGYV